jgi:tetratricopeptide (TPR) repeat protein
VVDARWPELEALNPGGRANKAWEEAGMTAESLILWGEAARREEQFDEAMRWYERAIALEPGLGDPWYYVGRLAEDQRQWLQAVEAYERTLSADFLRTVGRSSSLYRMGLIYQRHLDPPMLEDALVAYESALDASDFSFVTEEADCHFRFGEILYWYKPAPDLSIEQFKRAIELNDRHVWAHTLLGLAVYKYYHNATEAEIEFKISVELNPLHKSGYYNLGELYRQEGAVDKAVVMYQRALEIDPGYEAAQNRLELVKGGQ